ncbi:MAG: hypothetical protein ABJE95_24870 [Byssovorax sp.]
MSTDRRWAGGALVVVGLVSTLFAACARGNDTATTDTSNAGGGSPTTASNGGSGGGGTGTGGKPFTGEIGSPCAVDGDCSAGVCTQVGGKKYCTVACPPDCPKGTYCSIVNGDSICIPDLGQQCDQCLTIADCAMPTDRCFKAPLGDSFCARDCTTAGDCPNGFTCVDGNVYVGGSSSSGGMMDGGAPDGGDAGSDGGDAGSDAGSKPSMATKWCVPNSGFSCPCNEQRDGVTHDCHTKNAFGDCAGTEKCDGKEGKFTGCTASTPKAEACNGKDDNCNAKIDDGDGDALCASMGAPPPNSGWTCAAGTCSLGACDPGWTAYPSGPLNNGCQCPVEVGEPNGSCATAKDAGMVSDAGGSVTMQGTLSADNDVDFWTFSTVDTDEMTTNSYHVSIDFTAPTPNTEFRIDVIRGGTCSDVPTGPSTALVSYDWCVDGTGPAGSGELACSNVDPGPGPHCNDNSSVYFVRVYRKPGAVGTCTPYALKATAKGGDACDFTKQCP